LQSPVFVATEQLESVTNMVGMVARELRRKERAATKEEVDQILRTANVGRLGLSKNNQPYVVPLNFFYDETGHIYVHSAESGMMIEFLISNPTVCFEVDEYIATIPDEFTCKFDAAYRSVIVFGTARILTDLEQRTNALKLIVAKYAGREHAEALDTVMVDKYRSSLGSETTVIDMTIERVTGKVGPKESSG
jgi:nitroimidazol reductase NimA-like FMN-containing flavoprotein (pyridoxamine 5'-phosphate oxidase superfamily)